MKIRRKRTRDQSALKFPEMNKRKIEVKKNSSITLKDLLSDKIHLSNRDQSKDNKKLATNQKKKKSRLSCKN
jgi:hypothetical protein